jgi:hypothetical protein
MATRNLQLHIVTVGTTKVGISEPDKYGSIADIVGVKLAGTGDTVDDSATISELKKRGKLIRDRRRQEKSSNSVRDR